MGGPYCELSAGPAERGRSDAAEAARASASCAACRLCQSWSSAADLHPACLGNVIYQILSKGKRSPTCVAWTVPKAVLLVQALSALFQCRLF